jgi:ribosomal protein L40E
MTQRMFHGHISAAALADQLAARFSERHTRTAVSTGSGTALVQIGSKHGTPVSVHIADTEGGVLVTMSEDRDWLDKAGDTGEWIERAASGNVISLLAMVPDVIGEVQKENITPAIWDAVNDLCGLTRALAGEEHAPLNPKVCSYCQTANPPQAEICQSCGAALPIDLPRVCPKCGRGHTSDALFCQACGTRLVTG